MRSHDKTFYHLILWVDTSLNLQLADFFGWRLFIFFFFFFWLFIFNNDTLGRRAISKEPWSTGTVSAHRLASHLLERCFVHQGKVNLRSLPFLAACHVRPSCGPATLSYPLCPVFNPGLVPWGMV